MPMPPPGRPLLLSPHSIPEQVNSTATEQTPAVKTAAQPAALALATGCVHLVCQPIDPPMRPLLRPAVGLASTEIALRQTLRSRTRKHPRLSKECHVSDREICRSPVCSSPV